MNNDLVQLFIRPSGGTLAAKIVQNQEWRLFDLFEELIVCNDFSDHRVLRMIPPKHDTITSVGTASKHTKYANNGPGSFKYNI